MDKLPVYKDNSPLALTEDQLKKADLCINNIMQSMEFFKWQLHYDPRKTDVHTHMGLFESYFNELVPLVSYDSILEEEYKERSKTIREQNVRIRELESKLGDQVTAEGVAARLRYYDDVVRAWYGSLGFDYASLEKYMIWGIQYRFSPELWSDPNDGTSGEKELAERFQEKNTTLMSRPGYDLCYSDEYHADLLDTDNNRKQMKDLFTGVFPESHIIEYHSRSNDYGSFSLRVTVSIPYTDIEKLAASVAGEEEPNEREHER